jgi:phosphoketolase
VTDNIELVMRFHPVGGEDVTVTSADFSDETQALEAIAQAIHERHGLILTRARYNRETDENPMVINLANVVSVRVSTTDTDVTGQYL